MFFKNLFSTGIFMQLVAASDLKSKHNNEIVKVAGLVTLRQKPQTAKGVVFLSLEDETGIINVVCWKKISLSYYKAIISAELLLVTGRLQIESGTINIIASNIKDISHLLKFLPYLNKP